MSEWQPIESAPKDGKPLILAVRDPFAPELVHVGEALWRDGDDDFGEWAPQWWWANTGPGNYAEDPISGQPTHWQPLPEPPA